MTFLVLLANARKMPESFFGCSYLSRTFPDLVNPGLKSEENLVEKGMAE